MGITITRTHEGYSAKGDDLSVEAPTLAQLVELLSDAGCHSTDISDAVDAAGLPWPKVSE